MGSCSASDGMHHACVQEKEKMQLTAEEARRAADELVRKAKEKREVWGPCHSLADARLVSAAGKTEGSLPAAVQSAILRVMQALPRVLGPSQSRRGQCICRGLFSRGAEKAFFPAGA